MRRIVLSCFFFFQAEDGIRDLTVTGVQTCALPILLRIVVRPLDVVEGGRDVDRAAQVSVRWQTAAAYGGEVGELRQRDVDLERGARVVDALDGGYELGAQVLLLQQLEERDVRIGVRDDLPGLKFGPVFERHPL